MLRGLIQTKNLEQCALSFMLRLFYRINTVSKSLRRGRTNPSPRERAKSLFTPFSFQIFLEFFQKFFVTHGPIIRILRIQAIVSLRLARNESVFLYGYHVNNE